MILKETFIEIVEEPLKIFHGVGRAVGDVEEGEGKINGERWRLDLGW